MADQPLAVIVGANRGIGLGVTREFVDRDWSVLATARRPSEAKALNHLAAHHRGRVEVAGLEMNDPAGIDAFAKTLSGRTIDILLINAGVSGPSHRSAGAATEAEIGALMYTNAIGPIRLARALGDRLRRGTGVLAFTSSVMGSVALTPGGHELYRASKAALNSLTRGLWGELRGRNITVLTLHPGWVRTDMGGPGAAVSVEASAQGMVEVMLAKRSAHQHLFLDYRGQTIAW